MVISAVQMAVWQRKGKGHVILHSDRGSQFTSRVPALPGQPLADHIHECSWPLR